ncbi:hypothetical protein PIB30_056795 [Stylosanthes scabra]|uniref:Uncharacterized protein n=1 Tax=Stylosanthes scabra TaxID=79078 RepID=A0ABU6QK77_9FABA|nr:hypothetical protein [Stylosanthes scabra]
MEHHLDPTKTPPKPDATTIAETPASSTMISLATGTTTPNTTPTTSTDTTQGTIDEYLTKIRSISESLAAIGSQLRDDDHIQAIIDGLNEDYNGLIASVMTRFGTFTVPEAKCFLQAYEDMLIRNKNPGQPIPMANVTHTYFPSNGRGGGRRERRAGCFQRGGRNS